MILRATSIGELALRQISRRGEGRVRRVFRSSAYVETADGFILLLLAPLRSPMTVNTDQGESLEGALSEGDLCQFEKGTMRLGDLTLLLKGTDVYRSSLRRRVRFEPVAARELVRGVTMLRLLYDVSPPALDLVGDESFRKFIRSVLMPFSRGRLDAAYVPSNYLPLIGLGSGFTPAGDDFVSGFTAAFNYAARWTGVRRISLPAAALLGRTVPESATILECAQNGYVDEDLERLIQSAADSSRGSFSDELLGVARRGHTSGLDMSLGVILSMAAVRAGIEHDGTLEEVLRALTGSRTL